MIEYFYAEGERDYIFFCEILGAVSFDDNDLPLSKTDEQEICDAFRLVEYLVSSGDFEVGQMDKASNGELYYVPYIAGFEEFSRVARGIIAKDGATDDYLMYGIRLRKCHLGAQPPTLTQDIVNLFGHM